jgi:hypothetical protein
VAQPHVATAGQRPIFIVGSNGSGSTLLRLMLDSHPAIAIPEETGFLRLAMAHEWVPYWKLGDTWYRSLGLTEEQMHARVAEFYGGLFASYAQTRGKTRWGDKTPFHVWHLDLAMTLFPDAVVVGIVRHPGAVVSSLRRRFMRKTAASTSHWLRSNRQLLYQAEQLGDRCVLLRYEDLVREPEPVMRVMLERLGEPWSDQVLAHHEVQPANESTGFTRTDRPIDTAGIREWESALPSQARKLMVERTSPLAAVFGYDATVGEPVAAFGDAASLLVPGSAVGALKAAHPEVNWEPPAPRLEHKPLRPPPPRRRRLRTPPDLDTITIRDLMRHRLSGRMSDDTKRKAHEVRRSNPTVDRLIGPE